jgi:hypothetical protein
MLIYARIVMVFQIISSLCSLGLAVYLFSQGLPGAGVAALVPLLFLWLAWTNFRDASKCVPLLEAAEATESAAKRV